MKRAIIRASWDALVVGCSGQAPSEADSQGELTSITARSRELERVVYVPRGADDSTVFELARKPSHSAFGAMLDVEVGVDPMRVVDGETDESVPAATPIRVQAR